MKKTFDSSHQKTILDSINEGVFTIDLDWRITSFNRAAEKITRVKSAEALGRPCSEVFRASICENACALKRTLTTGMPTVNITARIVTEGGMRVPIRISTALLKDAEGRVVGGVETFQDLSQVEQLRKELESRYTCEDIIGRSSPMMKLFEVLPQIAESDSTVLIEGDSGTGKELFARAIHNLSTRKNKNFVAVNCAALPDTLLESELFGYKAGAFTGAQRNKPGRFAAAEGGTLFLDEIGDISPAMQVRLLRVLQERRIEPLGAVKSQEVDVRVVAATNKSLSALVQEGKFRTDLFYRIHVVQLKLPPLRERRADIPALVDHMVAKFNRLKGKDIFGVSENVMAQLMRYDYPGNVRELENIIEHAFVLCPEGFIGTRHLPPELRPADAESGTEQSTDMSLKAMEKTMISEALQRCGGNRKKTAEKLGIDYTTLYRKIRRLGIDPPAGDGRRRQK
ncbi:MAG: sigma 54-interacting transcriptional regulator [Desulfobacterales bacterium]|nr:sigma 54-interacting transcriptional regulator [Desulfobacterales bacterium]